MMIIGADAAALGVEQPRDLAGIGVEPRHILTGQIEHMRGMRLFALRGGVPDLRAHSVGLAGADAVFARRFAGPAAARLSGFDQLGLGDRVGLDVVVGASTRSKHIVQTTMRSPLSWPTTTGGRSADVDA